MTKGPKMFYDDACTLQTRARRSDDPTTRQECFRRAEQALKKVIQILEESSAETHLSEDTETLCSALMCLGHLIKNEKRGPNCAETALRLFHRAHDMPTNQMSLSSKLCLGQHLIDVGDYSLGLAHLLALHETTQDPRIAAIIPGHMRAAIRKSLANVYSLVGRHGEAAAMSASCLDVFEGRDTCDVSDTKDADGLADALMNSGETHLNSGNTQKALADFTRAAQLAEELYGAGHPNAVQTRFCVATAHFKSENFEVALKLLTELTEVADRSLGKGHPLTIQIHCALTATRNCAKGPTGESQLLRGRVLIMGVKKKPDMNGKEAEIVAWHADRGRYEIKLCDDSAQPPCLLKAENLFEIPKAAGGSGNQERRRNRKKKKKK